MPREESLGMGAALTQNANFTYDQATFIRVMINNKAQQWGEFQNFLKTL